MGSLKGHTLQYFKAKGASCYGCDPAIEAVEFCKKQGLNVVPTQMGSLKLFKETKFDVVMLLNVLEHVADPIKTIKEIKNEVLRKGGILVIEVPNDYNAFQECATKVHNIKKWWVAPPAHLNYFNKDTLCALLKGNEFRVEELIGSFPLEMFLLFGDNYVGNASLGRECHNKRVAFEMNLIANGYQNELSSFYKALAQANLGRQILVYAKNV
ncbi:MAG: class I SAM-dependent methyltransferase [Candidatus Berkiella sp.]